MKISIQDVSVGDRMVQHNIFGFEVACDPNGKFLKGWHPKGPGQWHVKRVSPGIYRIVHNLNSTRYGTIFRVIREVGSVEVLAANENHIDIRITNEGVNTDAHFHFYLGLSVDGVL